MDLNSRLKQLEDLDLFIKNKQDLLNNVLHQLGWNEESLQAEVKIPCPRNSEHWIPESAMSHHQEICEWIEGGYLREELEKQPPDSSFFYENSPNMISVKIDHTLQEKVLSECGLLPQDQSEPLDFPKTMDRWTVQLKPEQRLAVYDYVVQVAKSANKAKDVTLEDLMIDFEKKDGQDDKPKSQLELLVEMRDYKRRRQSYRAKNVHITKKSYTEIMKEVIENQTSYLAETIKSENFENTSREFNEEPISNGSKQNDYNDSPSSSRQREKYSEHKDYKESSRKHHHSKHESHRSHSPKRKKHKRDRSRSRSPSSRHKHKKSHKHKRSHD